MADVQAKKSKLVAWGFVVGDRDLRLNTAYSGKFMVVESHEESELPTADGSKGPWCIVGDDLDELINEAYDVWESTFASSISNKSDCNSNL